MTLKVDFHQIRASAKTIWRMVSITDDEGTTGWGEFTINADAADIAQRVNRARERLVGCNTGEELIERSVEWLADWPIGAAVYCSIDQAVADLNAQKLGLPLAKMLGGPDARETVSLYANINRGTVDRSPAGFAQRAAQAVAEGHDAIKMAPFDDMTPELAATDACHYLVVDALSRIAATAEQIADDAVLMVDCHWRLNEEVAAAIIPAVAEMGVVWFECPVPESVESVPIIRRLRERANEYGMRLAGCETLTGWSMFAPYVTGGAYDVIMPDVKYLGGYGALDDIVTQCQHHDVGVSLHNPSGPMAHAASLHASAAFCPGEALEFQFAETPLFDDAVNNALPLRSNAQSYLPTSINQGHGLGIAPGAEHLEEHP
jgi:galactonate dehydratase